jgi:hypothetical protein
MHSNKIGGLEFLGFHYYYGRLLGLVFSLCFFSLHFLFLFYFSDISLILLFCFIDYIIFIIFLNLSLTCPNPLNHRFS